MIYQMAIKTKVFILILNYRHYQDTIKCIRHLKQSDLPRNTQILVLDNSEDTVSVEKIHQRYPKITLIHYSQNLGFAGGNNPGIDYALKHGATHVLIINPDVVVPKKFLPSLLNVLKKNNLDIIAPAIKHQQKDQFMYGLEGVVDFSNGKATHLNLKKLPSQQIRPAQFVTFACVLISASVFKKAGLLNEKYFMYLEDVDFCLRAGRLGFQIGLTPKVIIKHKTSSSFSHPLQKLKISFRSQFIFISSWIKFPYNLYAYCYTLINYAYLSLLWTYHHYKYSK